MELNEIFAIIFLHFLFDFVLQTDKQAKGKSKNWGDLIAHTTNYSVAWMIPIVILLGIYRPYEHTNYYVIASVSFGAITFICHTITDYFTSRINAKLAPTRYNIVLQDTDSVKVWWHYPKGESWHNFFVSVGFDQVLHYVQLFLTYQYIK